MKNARALCRPLRRSAIHRWNDDSIDTQVLEGSAEFAFRHGGIERGTSGICGKAEHRNGGIGPIRHCNGDATSSQYPGCSHPTPYRADAIRNLEIRPAAVVGGHQRHPMRLR